MFERREKVRFKSVMDQNVIMDQMTVASTTLQIRPSSSSHIGNSYEKFEEISTLNDDFRKRLPSRPLASTKSQNESIDLDDSNETEYLGFLFLFIYLLF